MPTPPPDYGSVPTAAPSSSSGSNPNDIWGLGKWYGKPVVPTYTSTPGVEVDPTTGRPLHTNLPTPDPSSPQTTQGLMSEVADLWTNNPQAFEQIQQLLWQAGAYGQTPLKDIHLGQWTKQTQEALKGALENYSQIVQQQAQSLGTDAYGNPTPITGQQLSSGAIPTFFQFLAQNAQQASKTGGYYGQGSGATSSSAKPLQLANTSDLIASVQKAAESALGHTLTAAQAEKFAVQIHTEQQRQYQQSLSAAQAAQSGATNITSEQLPSVDTQAMQFAIGSDPQGFQQSQIQGYTNAFLNLFLPGGSGRPNSGVDPVAAAMAAASGQDPTMQPQQGSASASTG